MDNQEDFHIFHPSLRNQNLNLWRFIAVIAFIVMELSWVALWFQTILSTRDDIPYKNIFLILGCIMVVVYSITRITEHYNINLFLSRIVLFALLFLAINMGLKAFRYPNLFAIIGNTLSKSNLLVDNLIQTEFLVVLVILVACWRAIWLANTPMRPEIAISGFRFGILMFLSYGILLVQLKTSPDITLYTFLFFGLLATSSSRFAIRKQLRRGSQVTFDHRWIVVLIISITMFLGVSIGLFRLVNNRVISPDFNFPNILIFLYLLLISPIIWIVSLLGAWLGELLRSSGILDILFKALSTLSSWIKSSLYIFQEYLKKLSWGPDEKIIDQISNSLPYIMWASILFFMILILLTIRRYLTTERDIRFDDYQYLVEQQDVVSLIKKSFRKQLNKIAEGFSGLLHLNFTGQILAAARIRRVYARLMQLSAKLENPRPPSRTPLEFLPSLIKLFPQHTLELETITSAYLRVRYGELPESSDEVEIVDRAWMRVSAIGQSMLKVRKKTAR